MNFYSISHETFILNLNCAKNILLDELRRDEILTEEQANHYSKSIVITVVKPSWISGLFTKDKDQLKIVGSRINPTDLNRK